MAFHCAIYGERTYSTKGIEDRKEEGIEEGIEDKVGQAH